MRNMMQLLGGVAVAGAVAAGTTAFTANAGFTNSVSGAKSFLGGTGTHTIVGAELSTFTWLTTDVTVTPARVSSFKLTFTSDTPQNSVVTVTQAGTPGGVTLTAGTAPDKFYCTAVDVNHESTCTAGLTGDPGGYFTGIGTLTIKVV